MDKSKLISLITFAFYLIKYVISQETEFTIGSFLHEVFPVNKHYYRVVLPDQRKEYLVIQAWPYDEYEDYSDPNIFVSKTVDRPNYGSSDYKSAYVGADSLAIPKAYLEGSKYVYVGIECERKCNYNITMYYEDSLYLQPGESEIYTNDPVKATKLFRLNHTDPTMTNFYIYSLTRKLSDLRMKIDYIGGENNNPPQNIPLSQVWYNGYVAYLNSTLQTACPTCYISIEITAAPKEFVIIGHKKVNSVNNFTSKAQVFGYLNNEEQECFQIQENQNTTDQTPFILTAQTYLENAKIFITSSLLNVKEEKAWIFKDSITIKLFMAEMKNKFICIVPSGMITSYEILILKEDLIETNQKYNFPLVNGRPLKGFLPASNVTSYTHFTYDKNSKGLNLNLKSISGNPKLYGYVCPTYPMCAFNKEKVESYEKTGSFVMSEDVNNLYHIKLENPSALCGEEWKDQCRIMAVVYCKGEEECEYMISMNQDDDLVLLSIREKFSKFVTKGNFDYYTMRIKDPRAQKVVVVLHSHTGDADLHVSRDFTQAQEDPQRKRSSSSGNRDFIEFFKDNEDLLGNYYIAVEGFTNAFYTLYYYTSDTINKETQRDVESGLIFVDPLTMQDPLKKYDFYNRNIEDKAPFLVTFTTLNCEIEIAQVNMLTGLNSTILPFVDYHSQFIIKKDDPFYSTSGYPFRVKLIRLDSGSESDFEQCLVYIGGVEIYPERELTLNEGIPHVLTLSSDLPNITYIYPHIFSGDSPVFDIGFSSTSTLHVYLGVAEQKTSSSSSSSSYSYDMNFLITRGSRLQLPTKTMETKCKMNNLCNIFISIALDLDDQKTSLTYKIIAKSHNNVPSYLTKNIIRHDSVLPKIYQYYYTDIKRNEKGSVVLTNKRGSAVMAGKIVRKDITEANANWQQRVRLPVIESTELLYFDRFNGKMRYTENDTEKCVKGCELYIGVLSEELAYVEKTYTEYSILIKNSVVNLPVNQLVSGSLNVTQSKYDYYKFTVPYESEYIIIQLATDNGKIYVRQGTGLPSDGTYEWKCEDNSGYLVINKYDPTISQGSLVNKTFTIGVTNRFKLEDSVWYSLFVNVPSQGTTPIYEITTDSQVECQVETDDGYCDFAIPIREEDQIQNMLLYTGSHNGTFINNKFKIYVNFLNSTEYQLLSEEDSYAKRPRKGKNAMISSEGQYKTDYLLIKNSDNPNFRLNSDTYVLISVKAKKKDMIFLMASGRGLVQETTLTPFRKKLVYLKSHEQIQIKLPGDGSYYVELYRIIGSGSLYYTSISNYKIDEKITSFSLISLQGEKKLLISGSDEDFGFHISYDQRPRENIDELSYGRYNYILYPQNSFPVMYYIPLLNDTIDVTFNFKLMEANIDRHDPGEGDDDLVVTGIFADEEFIKERSRNSKAVPRVNRAFVGDYDPSVKVGRITIYAKDIREFVKIGMKYLFVVVNQGERNKNKFASFLTQVIAFPVNSLQSHVTLPHHHYLYSTLSGNLSQEVNLDDYDPTKALGHVYKLAKIHHKDKFMHVELATCSEDATFAITPYQEEEYKTSLYDNPILLQNSTEVKFTVTENYGKKVIQITLPDSSSGVVFAVFPKFRKALCQDWLKDCVVPKISFVLKYITDTKQYETYSLLNKGFVNWFPKENGELDVKWGKVIHDTEKYYITSDYFIRIIPKKYVDNISELTSICLSKNHFRTIKVNFKEMNVDEVSTTLEDIPSQEFYVSIIARTNEKEKSSSLLIYNPFQIGHAPENIVIGISGWLILLLVIVSLVLLLLLFMLYRKYNMTKRRLEFEIQDIRNMGSLPKSSKQIDQATEVASKEKYTALFSEKK